MNRNRLTTDKPHGNFETMMNFAYAKNGEVWLRGADDGKDAELCAYIAKSAFYLELCGITNKDDVIEACGAADCFCELGALFAAATQAAELRARLAAYEDTGLEPEEMRELLHDSTGPLHKKLGEWIDAWQDGRLLVLPCRVGDAVWFNTYKNNATECVGIQPHEVKRVNVCFLTDGAEIPQWEIGKTVFLTREDAEKALDGVNNDER